MEIIVQTLVAFVGVIAFAVLFQTPRAYCAACGATGAAGWALYLLLRAALFSAPVTSLLAAMFITLLARIFAVVHKCPTTTFLVCGIFPIVPGAGIYFTAYYFIMEDNILCLEWGMETIKIAVGIAVGIVLVLALPNGLFHRKSSTDAKTEH